MIAKIENNKIVNMAIGDSEVPGYVLAYGHNYIGQKTQSDGTPIPTKCPGPYYSFDNSPGTDCWCISDFTQIKTAKKLELSESCEQAITLEPFTSDALGSTHTYDCRVVDQDNINQAYIEANAESTNVDIMCNDGTSYEFRPHTALQCLNVLKLMRVHIRSRRDILLIKKGEVDSVDRVNYNSDAECLAAIEAIAW